MVPWLDKPKGSLKTFGISKDTDGNIMFEAEDHNRAVQRHLRPDTGTEAEEQWLNIDAEDSAAPLLNLERAWEQAGRGELITVTDEEAAVDGDTAEEKNASLISREVRYHLLATTSGVRTKKEKAEKTAEDEEACVDGGEGADSVAASVEETLEATTEGENKPKSLYGASILLKLQWEDRTPKKAVPERSYEQLALFVSNVTQNVETILEKNPAAGQQIVDAVALQLTPLIFSRYLDGVEACVEVLEESCFELLKLLAGRSAPREMHVALKLFVSKIDRIYVEAFSYLVLQPLVEIWGKVIVRMPTKRHAFLVDLFKKVDNMIINAESFENSFVPDSGVGVEKPGRIRDLPDITLKFLKDLTKIQVEQRNSDPSIQLQVDMLGREKAVPQIEGNKNAEGVDPIDSSADRSRMKNEKKAGATVDWVNERAVTLCKLLALQSTLWARLPLPPGEERNIPKNLTKIQKRRRTKESGLAQKAERSLAICMTLFHDLGWTNPILACQIAANEMRLDSADQYGDLMSKHIGEDMRTKKEKKSALYSITAVGLYVCGILRRGTRRRMSCPHDTDETDDMIDDYKVDLAGTVFDIVTPQYAFDVVMPYLMALVPQTNVSYAISAIMTIRELLHRIEDGEFSTFDEILRLRSGTSSMGRDANIYGLAHHLGKAVGFFEDPGHRRIAYETLQLLLRKCSSATARFVILEGIFFECTRVAVAAQLMTEMKNVLIYAESGAFDGKDADYKLKELSQLRSRFAEDCFPRYFTPRKELLVSMNAIATAAGLFYFLACKDQRLLERIEESHETVRMETKKRMTFCKEYGNLGKVLIRALASVAEHDRKSIPESAMAKKSTEDAQALFLASGRTLNQCIGSLSFIDSALGSL